MQRRFLLNPSDDANEIVLGCFGRALHLYPALLLHAAVVLSNHITMTITTPDAKTLADFMCHLKSNIARELGVLYEWKEKFWGRRYTPIECADEDSQVDRFTYVLRQGPKEWLVRRPQDWPGVTTVHALLAGESMFGIWFDRTAESNARGAGQKFGKYDFSTRYEIKLSPLPCWSHLSPEEYRARCAEVVEKIERETAELIHVHRRKPMGVAKILAQNPHSFPAVSKKKTQKPLCHASSTRSWFEYRERFREFCDAFCTAAALLRAGVTGAIREFPPGCFPPRSPFRPCLG